MIVELLLKLVVSGAVTVLVKFGLVHLGHSVAWSTAALVATLLVFASMDVFNALDRGRWLR